MTDDLQDLREAAGKATPGPWQTHLVDDTTVIAPDRCEVCTTCDSANTERDDAYNVEYERMEADAAYIAAANPTAMLTRLSALDTHSAEIERLRSINATLMGDDEDAPRYTTKRLRLEIQRATEAQAFRASELEALLHEARDTMLAPRAVYEPLVAKIDAALLGGTDGRATGEVRPVPETVGVDGWKLVPVEPTPDMLVAAGTIEGWNAAATRYADECHIAWWKVMLAASPIHAPAKGKLFTYCAGCDGYNCDPDKGCAYPERSPAEGKPVAWCRPNIIGGWVYTRMPRVAEIWQEQGCEVTPLYATPTPQGGMREALLFAVRGLHEVATHGHLAGDTLSKMALETIEAETLLAALTKEGT